jgi:rhomboid family GlyGly-CTERM serine protease
MPQTAPPSLTQPSLGRLPWCTLIAGALAVGAWFVPGAFDAFVYDRSLILGGQLWRIVTGHWVHFSASHLFWNLVILVPAGVWLERRSAFALRCTLLLSPLAISLALLAFVPSLAQYAGISGVASGVLVALAVHGLRTEPRAQLLWLGVLVLFGAKVAVETFGHGPLNPELATRGITSVPLAHLVGAAVGVIAVLRSSPPKSSSL